MASPSTLTVRSARVKHAKRLATRAFRAKTGEFLAEGPQAVREALATRPEVVLEVFATSESTVRHHDLRGLALTESIAWHEVEPEVLAELADAVTPQGIVARCRSVVSGLDGVVGDFVVVGVETRDPGNAGSLIRAADAAGASAVVFAGDSVDPLNPKAVRAAVGSHFHLPIIVERDVEALFSRLSERGLRTLAADGSGPSDLFSIDLTGPLAWLMGNEAHGFDADVRSGVDEVVSIPIFGAAESLNLATAATVCLYETARQRHMNPR